MKPSCMPSTLNCTALRRDWQRAEVLWEAFLRKQVKPNIICHVALAKVHLLAGRPGRVLKIFHNESIDLVSAMSQFPRVATLYGQALLVVYHSSLDLAAMKRLEEFLMLALDKCRKGSKNIKEDLLKMRQVLNRLSSTPEQLYLRDVLIEWKAKEQSVMAEWENFPAGSNYLEDQSAFKNSAQAKHTRGDSQLLAAGEKVWDMRGWAGRVFSVGDILRAGARMYERSSTSSPTTY